MLLEDEVIILRPMQPGYYPLFFSWITDPNVMGDQQPFHSGDFAAFVRGIEQAAANPPGSFTFLIMQKEGNIPVGFVGHFRAHFMVEDIEIGYVIIPQHRKNGYGTRAVRLLVAYLFRTNNLERIQALPGIENSASRRILVRCGFREEGRLRHYFFINGSYRDHFSYSITREDWLKSQADS